MAFRDFHCQDSFTAKTKSATIQKSSLSFKWMTDFDTSLMVLRVRCATIHGRLVVLSPSLQAFSEHSMVEQTGIDRLHGLCPSQRYTELVRMYLSLSATTTNWISTFAICQMPLHSSTQHRINDARRYGVRSRAERKAKGDANLSKCSTNLTTFPSSGIQGFLSNWIPIESLNQ